MEVAKEVEINVSDEENLNELHQMRVGETIRMGEWFVTKVVSGWIYTLKTSNAMSGGALAEHHSIFVPKE